MILRQDVKNLLFANDLSDDLLDSLAIQPIQSWERRTGTTVTLDDDSSSWGAMYGVLCTYLATTIRRELFASEMWGDTLRINEEIALRQIETAEEYYRVND